MKRAVILHGMPSEDGYKDLTADSMSNAHWLPWLQNQLCARGVLAQTPEMPKPYQPNYKEWREEFEKQIVDEQTVLVGHSCGGGFLIRWLTESSAQVGKLIVVAPWLDREQENKDLFDFEIDPKLAGKTKQGIDVLYSTNDGLSLRTSLAYLKETLPFVRYHEFINYGHFTLGDMKTREFPELLMLCLDS